MRGTGTVTPSNYRVLPPFFQKFALAESFLVKKPSNHRGTLACSLANTDVMQ